MGREILIYCGVDWAEKTHDVALVDDTGQLLAKRHITDDAVGYKILLDLLAEYGDTEEDPIPVAIETSRGLLVAVLRTGKREVFAINPMAAARYRDRHSVSRKKSDPGDALVLANILRTDMHAHRPLPNDSDLARAIAVLARAQQDATWNRQQIANQLRSLLREYYPSALAAADGWKNGLCRPEVREILRAAPTPTRAARLTAPSSRPRSSGLADSAASRPTPNGSATSFGLPGSISRCSSRKHLANRRLPSSSSWKPPVLLPMTWLRRWKRLYLSTRTLRSSSAFPASAFSSAPGCSPRSATTATGSRTPVA